MLFGVGKSVAHLVGIVSLVQCADRARNYALTAIYAGCLGKRLFKRAGDVGIKSAVVSTDHADSLHSRACSDAAAAKNALVVVSDYGRGVVYFVVVDSAAETVFVNSVLVAQLLKLAGGGTHAGEAVLFMV